MWLRLFFAFDVVDLKQLETVGNDIDIPHVCWDLLCLITMDYYVN